MRGRRNLFVPDGFSRNGRKVGGKDRKEARRGQIKWVGELWINITRKPVSFGASALVCVVMIIVESRCWYDL